MAHIIVRHKVKDFATWKQGFEASTEIRKNSGEKSYQILQAADDANHVVAVFEWYSVENAQKFFAILAQNNVMENAGVIDEPNIYFLNEAEKGSH